MNPSLKHPESLRTGLKRFAEQRLQELLEIMRREKLTGEQLHEARKAIKSLRATLRLTRGALTRETRKARNEVLKELGVRLSGPRDAAVTLSAFEKSYSEGMSDTRWQQLKPRWAAELHQCLASLARATVPAGSYLEAAEKIHQLSGSLLPFRDNDRANGHASQEQRQDEWGKTVQRGLAKTYRQGRRFFREVSTLDEPTDVQWHELRKRAKDLGYQLGLFKTAKGIKRLWTKLDKAGGALGDGRDLTLLRDYLIKALPQLKLAPADQKGFQRLIRYIDRQRRELNRGALRSLRGVYRRSGRRFTRRMNRQWLRCQGISYP
jgi:CHAD domain-containing protein